MEEQELTPQEQLDAKRQKWVNAKRKEVMRAGLLHDGARILPTDKTKARLAAAVSRAQTDSEAEFDWLFEDGEWRTLSAQGLIEMNGALSEFVEACFSRERELLAAIEGGTFDDSMLLQGWPA